MDARGECSRQSARILLVHLASESAVELCSYIGKVLENYFSIVCSMNGPCRLVFFGIIAVGSNDQIKVLLPLQHVKGNFNRILSTLYDLKRLASDWSINASSQGKDVNSIELAISEAITLFKRQAQGLLQATGHWSQLEIIFISSQAATFLMSRLCSAVKNIDLQVIKKIQLICVMQTPELFPCMSIVDDTETSFDEICGNDKEAMNLLSDDPCSSLIESYSMKLDEMSLLTMFMSWLHDSNTDQEHLKISFKESGLDIKCDLIDRMLHPACFTFYDSYNLSTNIQSKVISCGSGVVKTLTHVKQQEIISVMVISRIPIDKVCDSLLFGNPLIVRSTTCWKMDWDELELNQNNFQALCHLLHRNKEALIIQRQSFSSDSSTNVNLQSTETNTSSTRRMSTGAAEPDVPNPCGYFVLMPSNKCSLLLRSIVGSELLLPVDFPSLDTPNEDSVNVLSEAMSVVNVTHTYNPLKMNTGLHQSLIAQLTKHQRLSSSSNLAGNKRNEPQTADRHSASTYMPMFKPMTSLNTREQTTSCINSTAAVAKQALDL